MTIQAQYADLSTRIKTAKDQNRWGLVKSLEKVREELKPALLRSVPAARVLGDSSSPTAKLVPVPSIPSHSCDELPLSGLATCCRLRRSCLREVAGVGSQVHRPLPESTMRNYRKILEAVIANLGRPGSRTTLIERRSWRKITCRRDCCRPRS